MLRSPRSGETPAARGISFLQVPSPRTGETTAARGVSLPQAQPVLRSPRSGETTVARGVSLPQAPSAPTPGLTPACVTLSLGPGPKDGPRGPGCPWALSPSRALAWVLE